MFHSEFSIPLHLLYFSCLYTVSKRKEDRRPEQRKDAVDFHGKETERRKIEKEKSTKCKKNCVQEYG